MAFDCIIINIMLNRRANPTAQKTKQNAPTPPQSEELSGDVIEFYGSRKYQLFLEWLVVILFFLAGLFFLTLVSIYQSTHP